MTKRKTRKPVAYAIIDTDGSFLSGPSNSRTEVEHQWTSQWGPMENKVRVTKFVPANPRAAAVLKALLKWKNSAERGISDDFDLLDSVEAYEKSLEGKR
jgi:hypothetical protein